MKQLISSSFFAGFLISVSGYANLCVGGIAGSVIFAFGLISVCMFGLNLYTGQAGKRDYSTSANRRDIFVILLINIVSCILCGFICSKMSQTNDIVINNVENIIYNREHNTILSVFLKSVGCGFIMECACYAYRTHESYILVLFGIPLFILSGFYHSIADTFYYSYYFNILDGFEDHSFLFVVFIITIIGNFVGCNIRRFFLK